LSGIVVCSLQVEAAETQYMAVTKAGTTSQKVRLYEDLQDHAHRRYLGAIKALAQLRRLQVRFVAQLNLATNQVNVAQAVDASPAQVPGDRAPTTLPDHGVD
jgi:hypothetical protein